MVDIIDEANETFEQHLSKCIALARSSLNAKLQRRDEITCENCGDIIPEKRRRALPGCRTCLPCQEVIEKEQTR
jgi:phage/conjugal plasmid C-4 type zinc finger TraR family protein